MTRISALDAFRAVVLIAKHLDKLLPFLLAAKRIPAQLPQRIGLLQQLAREIAEDAELARDWFQALELLTDEDLSSRSVADLLQLAVAQLTSEQLGDVWSAAFSIGLLDEESLQPWLLFEGITNADEYASRR